MALPSICRALHRPSIGGGSNIIIEHQKQNYKLVQTSPAHFPPRDWKGISTRKNGQHTSSLVYCILPCTYSHVTHYQYLMVTNCRLPVPNDNISSSTYNNNHQVCNAVLQLQYHVQQQTYRHYQRLLHSSSWCHSNTMWRLTFTSTDLQLYLQRVEKTFCSLGYEWRLKLYPGGNGALCFRTMKG